MSIFRGTLARTRGHPLAGPASDFSSAVAVRALPHVPVFAISVSVSRAWRLRLLALLIATGLAAVVLYIGAVNAILLRGETLREERQRLLTLEDKTAELQGVATRMESPAWVRSSAVANGMVEVTSLRYLVARPSPVSSR